MFNRLICFVAGILAVGSGVVNGHGSHSNDQPPSSDWATRHMMEEHHIESFDWRSFFALHDYDSSGTWTADEIRKTYGIDDETNNGVDESRKAAAVQSVLDLFDSGHTGSITDDNWMKAVVAGTRLPDLGFGPGHHGDLEYEYEIHHFEKFHGDDATEEELNHPEDIEHFRRHDEEEAAGRRLEKMEQMQIVEVNIPAKFIRAG